VAIVEARQIDDGANTRIEPETEIPALPAHFAIGDFERRAERLAQADRRCTLPWRGVDLLKIDGGGGYGNRPVINHLEYFLFDRINFDVETFN
jgi:hypothetical protein